ncbi:MAG: hypothetical protein RL277_2554 [Planctomycetota bacterium]
MPLPALVLTLTVLAPTLHSRPSLPTQPVRSIHPAPSCERLAQPTLQQRIDALANLPPQATPHVIELPQGSIELKQSLRIGPGVPPLELRAHAKGSELHGAMEILEPQWEAAEDGLLELSLSPAQRERLAREWQGPVHSGHGIASTALESQLFVGGHALTLARWPDSSLAPIESLRDGGSVPRQSEPDIPLAQRSHEPPRGARWGLADAQRLQRWAAEPELWASGYWNWDWSEEQLPLRAEPARGELQLLLPHRYGVAQRGRWYLRNARCELDREGEYWVDRKAGRVWARLSAAQRQQPVRLSLLGTALIELEGARGFTLSGVRLAHSRSAGLRANNCAALRILDCEFTGLGTSGCEIEGREACVRGSRFLNLGGMGVRLSGGDRLTLAGSASRIENCRFEATGALLRTYHPAVQLEGVGHLVQGCEFSHLPHFALMAWGNDHLIEGNRFHHVVRETGDAGAIYFGRDWTTHGNVIRRNLFHDIEGSEARYQNAVYLDDMASGILVEENTFVRCNWGILAGGGRDNLLRANRFIDCRKALHYDARGVGWMAPALADPQTSTILQRWRAMPLESEAWKRRFPSLSSYASDRMGRPVGARVLDNELMGTPLGTIEDRECVQESGTMSREHEAGLAERVIAQWPL